MAWLVAVLSSAWGGASCVGGAVDAPARTVDGGVDATAPSDAGPTPGPADAATEGAATTDAATDAPNVYGHIFVSSDTFMGDGPPSPQDADAYCQNLAARKGFTGTYIAWLSDGATNAYDRIQGKGPWYRVDGTTLVFPDASALKGKPQNPVLHDENGATTTPEVWTGTNTGGTAATAHCSAWQSASGAQSGLIGKADGQAEWTEWTSLTCDRKAHLYCLRND